MEQTAEKRVAVVMPRLSRYGGAEGFAWRLAEALAAEGRSVDFVCARAETEPPSGVRVLALGRFGPLRWRKVLGFARAAEATVAQGGYALAFDLGKTGLQDVVRVGGGPLPTFWKHSIRAWPPGPARALKMLRRRLNPASRAILAVEQRQFRAPGAVFCVSHLVRDWLLECHPGLDPDIVRVVYNRPDLERFSPPTDEERASWRKAAGTVPDQRIIATAATNFRLKGVEPLIRALALLPEDCVLHVAGGRGSRAYRRLAARLGLAERVRFLGRVEDMRAFYGAADLFVLPTFYDACSNAVVEALACGRRTLSSAMNGSAVMLPARWVFDDPWDAEALAECMARALAEPEPGPFAWPEELDSGLGPYLDLAAERLGPPPGAPRQAGGEGAP